MADQIPAPDWPTSRLEIIEAAQEWADAASDAACWRIGDNPDHVKPLGEAIEKAKENFVLALDRATHHIVQ